MKKNVKSIFLIFLLLYVVINISIKSLAQTAMPEGVLEYKDSFYYFYNQSINWDSASDRCQQLGGHLATITSADENEFLVNNLPDNNVTYYWLGGTDQKKEGEWVWVTGEKFEYTNWADNSPNNNWGVENYLGFMSYEQNYDGFKTPIGSWNDFVNTTTENHGFICEWENNKYKADKFESPLINIENFTLFNVSIFSLGGISILGGIIFFTCKRK